MLEVRDWVTIAVALLLLLGTYLTVRATRGKTQADAKTAFDERVDQKMTAYTDRLEKRLDRVEAENKTLRQEGNSLKDRVEHLEDAQERSTKREKLLYKYTAALRDHIMGGFPPPPPTMPVELLEWYKSYDSIETGIPR